jgi:hypothetical protein
MNRCQHLICFLVPIILFFGLVLLENCPSLTSVNAFGLQNLTLLGLQSVLRGAINKGSPLQKLELGGFMGLTLRELHSLKAEFPKIQL